MADNARYRMPDDGWYIHGRLLTLSRTVCNSLRWVSRYCTGWSEKDLTGLSPKGCSCGTGLKLVTMVCASMPTSSNAAMMPLESGAPRSVIDPPQLPESLVANDGNDFVFPT